MPTNYTNRVVTILLCLWVSLSAIFPRVPGSLFWLFNPRGEVSFKHSLRPGIDMVGGTSLTYEIKQPEGGGGEKLAEQVATALKRRVDPNGVRNLVWRPQGADRLEIQMPLTRASAEGEALRKTYTQARDALDASNIPPVAVSNDIESLPAADREAKIREYAGQSEDRLKVLQEMATLADQIKSGREKRDFDAVARARLSYEALQDRLHATNVSIPALEQALQLTGTARDNALKPFRDRVANAPDRQDALSAFIKAYDEFASVRDRIDDAADLKRQLRGSGVLSFHILANPGIDTEFQQYVERLRTEGPRPQPGDRLKWFVVDRPQEFRGQAYEHNGKWYVLGHIDQGYSLMKGEGLPEWSLDRASADSDERGRPAVAFQFDAAGANYFGQLTQTFSPQGNRTYQLGIVLDDKLFSAPNINGPIGGRGIITGGEGGFSTVEQEYLVGTLNAGALPAQLNDEPISEITVGPQLGSDNLHAGLWSCAAGLVIVAIFMIGYYYLSGLVAFVAVVINLILILGVMALFKATFTLPGVAGVVLSVAMAVDANVLIFERLREEQARGLSLKMALRNSYDRAFSAILDGQVTTAISSAFLFLFGSEEVRGFGLTLLIGIITSLFTALYVTKTIFAIAVDKFGLRDLSSLPRRYPRWNQLMTPKVDWVGKSWIFVAFSIGFITLGLIAFGAKLNQRQALDIEFSGGTGVRVALKEGADMDRAQLQNLMEEVSQRRPNDLAAPRVVSVENDRRQYAITTTTTDTRAVQSAVIEGLGDRLDVKKPSRFTNVDADLAGAENQTVIPIESAATRIEGIPPSELASHIGGVAIVIDQLDPPLTKEQILDRIEARRYQED
ncbi:MAG TPA: protein translocase subunit SecD, partial [Tepidisphaeraceae bacterium]